MLCSLKVPQLRPSTTEKQLISTRLPAFLQWCVGICTLCTSPCMDINAGEYFMHTSESISVRVHVCVVEPVLHPSRLTLTLFLNAKNVFFCFFSFCNVSSRVTVDQHGNLAFSLLMFHLLSSFFYFTFLILTEVVSFIKLPQNTCQHGCSQIIINKIMTASVSPPPVCSILDGCQSFVLAVWFCARACVCVCVCSHSYSW